MPFFKRQKMVTNIVFVAMTDFGPDLDTLAAFPSEDVKDTLPIALKAYRQLYIAESEKYAHMSYFFNGGYNHPVAGEDRLVIPSPEVHTYDQFPAMSTEKIVSTVEAAIAKRNYEFIAINIAAPDMVSHTGNLHASIKAVEVVDAALARLEKAILKVKGYLIVTADHGNIEGLKNPKTREVDTEHSTNPVPFILIGSRLPRTGLRKSGKLGDIAPTICDLFHLRKPKEMTGSSLIEKRFRLKI
jgi:2,3-bisphosphoglycerate-independent phosphoglycerate mutase